MSIILGNILIIVYTFMWKKSKLVDICSLSGIVLLYLFCVLRMFIPIEFPWVIVIPERHIYNFIYSVITMDVGIIDLKVCHIFAAIWIAGTVVEIGRLSIKYHKYAKLFDSFASLGILVGNEKFGIKDSSIIIIKNSCVPVPISFGIIKKRILIPANIYQENEEKYIVAHEYMHIKNHDLLIQLLVNVLCGLYWWNPLVYLLRLDLGRCFELRCDSNVTKDMTNDELIDYLQVLLKTYKYSGIEENNKISLGFMGIRMRTDLNIKERFNYLAQGKNKKHKIINNYFAFIISVVLLILSYAFIFQPKYDAPRDEFGKNSDICYEVTTENGYLIEKEDGNYIFRTDKGDEDIISEEMASVLVEQGFELIDLNGGK